MTLSALAGSKTVMDFPVLIDLYRSTFVRFIQERFQSMLADLSLATDLDAEDFDSTLQDHLADVWSDLRLGQKALSESFAKELADSFARFLDQMDAVEPNSGAGAARQTDQKEGYRRPLAFDENLARMVVEIELRQGRSIRGVNEAYGTLVGCPPEALSLVPWNPAVVLEAFAAVLNRIEVPIHRKVRLVLYGKFIRNVLSHFGEACLAFRDGLNERAPRDRVCGEVSAGAQGAAPQFLGGIVPGRKGFGRAVGCDAGEAVAGKSIEVEDEVGNATPPDGLRKDGAEFRRYARVFAFLLLTMILGIAAWQLGTRLAERRLGSFARNETASPAEAPVSSERTSPGLSEESMILESAPPNAGAETALPESESSGLAEEESARPPIVSDARAKRDVMRAVELVDFDWTVKSPEKAMLFNFTVSNGSGRRVGGVEVVCLQYSKDLELLEPLKAVLPGMIEPNTSKSFADIPAGFANKRVDRVNCIIPDLSLE